MDRDRDLPPDDADELTWLLFHQDNVLTRSQALHHLTPKAIEHRTRSGRWLSLHRGVLLADPGPVTLRQRHWAAVLAAAASGAAYLAGLSALQSVGLRRITSPVIHVLLPADRDDVRPPAGVRLHRSRRLDAEDVHGVGLPPATMPARSLVDATQWASSPDEARTIMAATFQQRLVSVDDVAGALGRMRKVRRLPLLLRTLADVATGSHTLAELDILALCRRGGLPEPNRQFRADADGNSRYLDLLFEEWGLHVEIDGRHHLEIRQWWRDLHRQNTLSVHGWRLLRFPSYIVREQPDVVIAQIRAALTAAGWSG
jgi:very-short-patch-repair endonuclease